MINKLKLFLVGAITALAMILMPIQSASADHQGGYSLKIYQDIYWGGQTLWFYGPALNHWVNLTDFQLGTVSWNDQMSSFCALGHNVWFAENINGGGQWIGPYNGCTGGYTLPYGWNDQISSLWISGAAS